MKSLILGGLISLMAFFPTVKDSTLDDIVKPYLGEYECRSAQLGTMDYLEKFSYIRLELKENGTFLLHFKEKKGSKKKREGKYFYDKEKGVVKLVGKGIEREISLNDGLLTISMPIGKKNLVLQFEQK